MLNAHFRDEQMEARLGIITEVPEKRVFKAMIQHEAHYFKEAEKGRELTCKKGIWCCVS